MTSTPITGQKTSLGVGAIVSNSFSILFRNLIAVMIVAFIPSLIGLLVSVAMNGVGLTLGVDTGEALAIGSPTMIFVGVIVQFAIQGLTIALLVQLAYDAKLGNAITPIAYISPAIKAIVPIMVLSLVIGILAGIGFVLLIIPGLYIYAVFCVTTPAIMIERAGFGGMGRSAALTKDYRWPVVGALILLGICTAGLGIVTTFLVSAIVPIIGLNAAGFGIGILLFALVNGLTYGLSGIGAALIYARLRDIKEGVSVDKLAAVFD
ncbi:hypothetical protein [Roseobacter sp. CCS2]|uniref:hypothetical protein n=1 Tax=Roseobacter sp. CCS2 TaxID=391593 RepID=UPI0000F3F12D|nr:hypothetical protein [Roseobacter sp. CCS2]EBA11122.1 hypothetical protein RCCS2_10135 [Roseobacter sp. CCS2]